MSQYLVPLCLLFIPLVLSSVQYKDCGSKTSTVTAVDVSGCPSKGPCPLPRGQNVTFDIKFITSAGVNDATVTAVVHGILAGVPIPFPIQNADGCKDSGLQCPLKAKTSYGYKHKLFIKPSYPKLRLVVKWELKGPTGQDLVCLEIPVAITNGKKTPVATKPPHNHTINDVIHKKAKKGDNILKFMPRL